MIKSNIIVSYGCSTKNENIVKTFARDLFIGKTYKLINIDDLSTLREKKNMISISMLILVDDLFMAKNSFILECIYNYIIVLSDGQCNSTVENFDNVYCLNINDGIMCGKLRIKFLNDNNFFAPIDDDIPFVSCICPTHNRHKFLPTLFELFNNQDYPKELCELIVLDDGPLCPFDANKYDIHNNIRYYHIPTEKPLSIGKKRNMLHQLIRGKYVVCFDDDDYYPPNRISHCVDTLKRTKKKIAGASELFIYYCDIKQVYKFGPYSKTHATNGTLGYHYSIIFDRFYDDYCAVGEEKQFLNNFRLDLAQLKTIDTILCIAHKFNTFDKKIILQYGKKTDYKLENFVTNKNLLNMYESLDN